MYTGANGREVIIRVKSADTSSPTQSFDRLSFSRVNTLDYILNQDASDENEHPFNGNVMWRV